MEIVQKSVLRYVSLRPGYWKRIVQQIFDTVDILYVISGLATLCLTECSINYYVDRLDR